MPTALKVGQSIEAAKEEWYKDIYFFRDKCKDKNKFVDESPEIKKKRMEVEIEAKEEKFERIKDKENEDDQKKIEKKVEDTTKVALQARRPSSSNWLWRRSLCERERKRTTSIRSSRLREIRRLAWSGRSRRNRRCRVSGSRSF